MHLQIRQLRTLIWKDFLLSFSHGNAKYTICRAFAAPIILAVVLVTVFRLFLPTGTYGIGPVNTVRSVVDGMNAATHGRETLVLINLSDSIGGDIDRVIEIIAKPVRAAGKKVVVGTSIDQLRQTCRSTLVGTTKCYAAATFFASPSEGYRKSWFYSLRADAALGNTVDMTQNKNDGQVYVIPLQHAIDAAIGSLNGTTLLSAVNEYPFTSLTEEGFRRKSTLDLVKLNMNTTACVWVLSLIGVVYHLVHIITEERESEISSLMEAMMPNTRRWECQAIRILAHHLAFDLIYGMSWILTGGIAKAGLFHKSNGAIIIFGFVLSGLAFVSFSIIGAAFFKRSQLSGITVLVFAVTITVVGQTTGKWMSTATIAVLSLLFTPIAFVEFFILCTKFEYQEVPINLLESTAPNNPWQIPAIVFFVFFVIQILVYPFLAAFLERSFFGTAAERTGRSIMWPSQPMDSPIRLKNFTKMYRRHWFSRAMLTLIGRKPTPIYAVRDLTLQALNGQIMVLLGANGCGKSSTLNSIAGLSSISNGEIIIDGAGGIGLCPQKTVLWNSLSVLQHAQIFNRLKSKTDQDIDEDVNSLINACGLDEKVEISSRKLSGGQRRKLQLILMLTGGSRVCAVDEVSSGLDPISRRKIWDILLAERGKRTIVLTTHFLDEAEVLADHVVVMSKGELKGQGSVSELKSRLGNGYRIRRFSPGEPEGTNETISNEDYGVTETVGTASEVLEAIKRLDEEGISGYQINGPTFEEVFLRLAADSDVECEDNFDFGEKPGKYTTAAVAHESELRESSSQKTDSVPRARTTRWGQIWTLFKNRWTVFKRNPAALLLVLLLPVAASGLILQLLKDFINPGCTLSDQVNISTLQFLDLSREGAQFILGPRSAFTAHSLQLLSNSVQSLSYSSRNFSILPYVHFVSSLQEFDMFIKSNQSAVNPGGIWISNSSTTFIYRSDIGTLGVFNSLFVQNMLNSLLLNSSISADYTVFDFPLSNRTGDVLQLVFYFGLVMAFVPSFFVLYPSRDRIRYIRAMKYSNGVKPFELWFAYTLFDWLVFLLTAALIVTIFTMVKSAAWFGIGYLFIVLCFYGLASLLLAYIISLYSKSGLSAFALMAAGQATIVLLYLGGYLIVLARVEPDKVLDDLKLFHFTFSIISPIAQLLRASIVGLNLFGILCSGSPPQKVVDPGRIGAYGGPILYLVFQSFLLFGFLVWQDHEFSLGSWRRENNSLPQDEEDIVAREKEVLEEQERVANSIDGLRVLHLSKLFKSGNLGKVYAVDDLTFGVKQGEVFGLLGPNGAGKSTTISLLRGDIKPSTPASQLLLKSTSILHSRTVARQNLGVCPQYDAIDLMTVREHLAFYASIRGVADASAAVDRMIRNVGLQPFADRLGDKLSGGNKRKLSLAIALIGGPSVLLLDEPSTGLDPLAKRKMWSILRKFKPGRSILLTTHSMEEADALANRVGIISKRLLDIGTTEHLREKYGSGFHVHLVLESAPQSTDEDMRTITAWVKKKLPGTQLDGTAYHGQMHFNVPRSFVSPLKVDSEAEDITIASSEHDIRSVATIFRLLEENKAIIGVRYYAVSRSMFDEVFLNAVNMHGVKEEDMGVPKRRNWGF